MSPAMIRSVAMTTGLKAEIWIALASMVIAVASLWSAVDASRQSRIHNMLSLRPILKLIRVVQADGAGIEVSNKDLAGVYYKVREKAGMCL